MDNIKESKLYRTLDDSQKSSVDLCARFVESLWEADPIIQNYTDHSLKHSLRILIKLEELLCKHINNFLSREETYLLVLGVLLHDIGMQCDLRKLADVKQIAVDKFAAVFDEVFDPNSRTLTTNEQNEIRENHHLLTAARIHSLALDTSQSEGALAIHSIENNLIGDLIDICKFHSKLHINDCDENFKNLSNGRKRLISALVRLGDELDISKDRVNMSVPSEFNIPLENGLYWFLHNNTNVTIQNDQINVYYNVRPDEANRYMVFLQQDIIKFKDKNEPLLEVLWKYGLRFRFSSQGVYEYDYAHSLDNEYTLSILSKCEEIRNNLPVVQRTIKTISENSKVVDNAVFFEFIKNEQFSLFEAIKSVYLERVSIQNNVEVSMREILLGDNNYVLLGEAGFGKTFYSKNLCFEALSTLSDKHRHFPVFINLINYGNVYNSLVQALHSILSRKFDISADDCKNIIDEGGFFFILDGLDEVTSENYKKCICELKEHIKNLKNRFFITCRTNRYFEELVENCEKITLSKLTNEQIDKFFDSHSIHKYEYRNDYDTLRNPLLLSMIPTLIDERGVIPVNKALMYKKFCMKIFESWDAQKGVKFDFNVSDLEMFLGKIAFDYFDIPYISRNIFDGELSKHFGVENHKNVLDCIIKTGLLECDDIHLKYTHKTFKEYFVAMFLLHNYVVPFNKEELTKIICNKDYHEVNLFIAGLIFDYDSQKKYFELMLPIDLNLYSECMYICPNIRREVNGDFARNFLSDIAISYEEILNLYFSDIKSIFYPFIIGYAKHGLKLGITGNYSKDTSSLYFSLHMVGRDDERVNIAEPRDIFKDDFAKPDDWKYPSGVKKSRSINLGLSGYSENSAQRVALDVLISELKEILEKRRLKLCKHLIASFIGYFQNKWHECKDKSFDELSEWIDNEIEDAIRKTGSKDVRVIRDRVYLQDLQVLINLFKETGCIYYDFLLPKPDVLNPVHGWVWNFYSKSRAIEYLQAFFLQYQHSFIEMCNMNFSTLKNSFPDYVNYPYRYVVDIKFPNVDKNEYHSDYVVRYYYESVTVDSRPLIQESFAENVWDFGDGIEDNIRRSYANKPFSNNFSIHGATFSNFLQGRKDSTALIEMVFEKLENNLKGIFGKVWR